MTTFRHFVADLLPARMRTRWLVFEGQALFPLLARTGLGRVVGPFLIRNHLARPDEIDIEVTSGCDADCIMCPRRAIRRRQGPMDLDLFRKIVDEAVTLGVRGLCLNGYGEIAILKNYRDYIGYVRQKSRSIRIVINSNGMRMDEEMARCFIEANVNMVNVTIDGATAETFESIRKHLKLEQVEANVRRLIALRDELGRKYPMVRVGMLDMPENHHEVGAFLAKWTGVADHAGLGGLYSRLGAVSYGEDGRDWQRTPCWLLWNQMPVLSDGSVALCCDDWDGEAVLGNLHQSTIRELWVANVERQRLRALHLEGRSAEIPICASCRQPRQGPWWFRPNVRGGPTADRSRGRSSEGLTVLQ